MSTNIQTQALWYAWGQQDAGIGRSVDALAFAQYYRRLDEQGSRRSIQDEWKAYISPDMIKCEHCGRWVPFAETSENMCDVCPDTPIAAIADEVRDFLARAIDNSMPTCDVCEGPAPHCIGGTDYFCDEHVS